MSIQGINSGFAAGFVPGMPRPGNAEEAAPGAPQRAPQRVDSYAPSQAAASTTAAVPADVPQGTDPALWGVLTKEERSFFERARAMGPLTYGPGASNNAAPGVRLGGRIDVKV